MICFAKIDTIFSHHISSLLNDCCVRGSPFKSILCLSCPPCPSVVCAVRVPKLVLLCSTAVFFYVSQTVKFSKGPNCQSILCALLSMKRQKVWTKCQMWQAESLFHDGLKFVRMTLWNTESLISLSQWHKICIFLKIFGNFMCYLL